MNPIQQALGQGYSPEDVLKFVLQQYPHLSGNITKAVSSGFTPSRILGYIMPFIGKNSSKGVTGGTSQQNIHARRRQADVEANKALAKQLASVGATVGLGYLGARALPGIAQGVAGAIGGARGGGQPPNAPQGTPGAQAQAPQVGQQQAPPTQQQATQILGGLGIIPIIQNLAANNPPATIAAAVKHILTPKIIQKLSAQTPHSIDDLLAAFLGGQQGQNPQNPPAPTTVPAPQAQVPGQIQNAQIAPQPGPKNTPQIAPQPAPSVPNMVAQNAPQILPAQEQEAPFQEMPSDMAEINRRYEEYKKTQKPREIQPKTREQRLQEDKLRRARIESEFKEKPKLIVAPDGKIGEVEDERQGIIKFNAGKRTRTKRAKDLETLDPVFKQKVVDMWEALPDDQKSAPLALVQYSPNIEFEVGGGKYKTGFLFIQFNTGDSYLYPNATQEQADRITKKMVKAKTTNENAFHAYYEGEASRGAGMVEIIKELEKEFGRNFVKFDREGGYDANALQRKALEQHHKEKKAARERDEEETE